MIRRKTLAVLWILALGLARPIHGQSPDTVYVGSHHSPVTAGFLEALSFPTAGFAYAGDWSRGLLPNAVRVATLIGFGTTYDEAADECTDTACTLWAFGVVGTTVWSVVEAVRTARDHNERVREPSSLVLIGPSPTGGISVGIRLPMGPGVREVISQGPTRSRKVGQEGVGGAGGLPDPSLGEPAAGHSRSRDRGEPKQSVTSSPGSEKETLNPASMP